MKFSHILHRVGVPVVRTQLPGFDGVYYRYWYRDIQWFGGSALTHYLEFGWKEGRDPSAGFSSSGYLAANPDVAAAGLNPLIHFLNHGLAEGRGGWHKDPRAPAPMPKSEAAPMLLLAPPN